MDLSFNRQLAAGYKSSSQIARVLTEAWVKKSAFCPNCGSDAISRHPNNSPVLDFYCTACQEDFELKSKRNALGNKLMDGAYRTMMDSIGAGKAPNFFALSYDASHWQVRDFIVIPKNFFVPSIIEQRKPLAVSARRANWVGCNINLSLIPESGRIYIVRGGEARSKHQVRSAWDKVLFLKKQKDMTAKGWLLDVMRCIEQIPCEEFTLAQLYAFEHVLQDKHVANRNIRAKIRQQLQILRDKNYLTFIGQGFYRKG